MVILNTSIRFGNVFSFVIVLAYSIGIAKYTTRLFVQKGLRSEVAWFATHYSVNLDLDIIS